MRRIGIIRKSRAAIVAAAAAILVVLGFNGTAMAATGSVFNDSKVGLRLEVYTTDEGYRFIDPGHAAAFTVTRYYLGPTECASVATNYGPWHLIGPGWYGVTGSITHVQLRYC